MKISEVIQELEKVLSVWGDVPVKVGSIEGYQLFDVQIIPIDSSKRETSPAGRMVLIDRIKDSVI